jgi:hypothetical protein
MRQKEGCMYGWTEQYLEIKNLKTINWFIEKFEFVSKVIRNPVAFVLQGVRGY